MTAQLFSTGPSAPRTVTLVRLAAEIARSLAPVGRIAVEGEVYRPKRIGSGRVYFTLKDRAATIAVACPSGRAARCRAVDGERVCVVGTLSWISDRGDLQLLAEQVTPVGDGAVAAMIAQARARLDQDGLLERPKRRLPRLPRTVGVVCGADAAVRKDIESVVATRYPGFPVRFEETYLSGPGASLAIIDALARLVAHDAVEVVVLARGGGDATQLLPFSDEDLCRAIAACPVPVVSAIGHEGDRPLCDEVADLRCATPLAAAAAVVPDRATLESQLATMVDRAGFAFDRRREWASQRLAAIDAASAVQQGASLCRTRLERCREHLGWSHPGVRVAQAGQRLASVDARAAAQRALTAGAARFNAIDWRRRVDDRVAGASGRLDADARHIRALAPQRVLERGYAVVRAAGGSVLRDASQVTPGDRIEIQVAAGRLSARVEAVHDA